ncbi:hypothetical protein B0H11DRAFT_1934426 [Mycena galericulata]|nr:hypothetical protein B0H11DRAFT_1934426 [Mycena galericulata]
MKITNGSERGEDKTAELLSAGSGQSCTERTHMEHHEIYKDALRTGTQWEREAIQLARKFEENTQDRDARPRFPQWGWHRHDGNRTRELRSKKAVLNTGFRVEAIPEQIQKREGERGADHGEKERKITGVSYLEAPTGSCGLNAIWSDLSDLTPIRTGTLQTRRAVDNPIVTKAEQAVLIQAEKVHMWLDVACELLRIHNPSKAQLGNERAKVVSAYVRVRR